MENLIIESAHMCDKEEKNKFQWLSKIVKLYYLKEAMEVLIGDSVKKIDVSRKSIYALCNDVIYYGKRNCAALFDHIKSKKHHEKSGEPNERTTLLGNPVSNNIGRPLFSQDFSDVVSGQLGDEQAALNKILHKTAIDIIDVSAIPTHLEQKDYIDRLKLYQRRLAALQLSQAGKKKCLLRDIALPEKVLSENPLLLADIKMIDDAFIDACVALKSIEVEPQGDLVTKFGVS